MYRKSWKTAVVFVFTCLIGSTASAIGNPSFTSPLFDLRNNSHVQDLDRLAGVQYFGLWSVDGGIDYKHLYARILPESFAVDSASPLEIEEYIWNPLSLGISGCIFSGCAGSVCFYSGCFGSGCFGSACAGSGCGGTSVCGLSGCVTSVCGVSGCVVSYCGTSGCGNSGCSCPVEPGVPRESSPIVAAAVLVPSNGFTLRDMLTQRDAASAMQHLIVKTYFSTGN